MDEEKAELDETAASDCVGGPEAYFDSRNVDQVSHSGGTFPGSEEAALFDFV